MRVNWFDGVGVVPDRVRACRSGCEDEELFSISGMFLQGVLGAVSLCDGSLLVDFTCWLDDILKGQDFQTLRKLEISGFHIEIESMLTFIHKHASSLQSVTFKKCSIYSETFKTQLIDVLSQYTDITSCVTDICIWPK